MCLYHFLSIKYDDAKLDQQLAFINHHHIVPIAFSDYLFYTEKTVLREYFSLKKKEISSNLYFKMKLWRSFTIVPRKLLRYAAWCQTLTVLNDNSTA